MAARVCLAIVNAVVTRLLFAAHCLVTVWRVVHVYADQRYWALLAALALLLVETMATLVKRKGRELKWFCPSFLIYLSGVVPGIWFLELDRLERHRSNVNNTEPEDFSQNATEQLTIIEGFEFEIPVTIHPDMWVNSIEQSMLLLLIIGRWMLPKGDISRDQLSQLLFVYIGMASDIMELYHLFQEPKVLHDELISYVILGVWSLSLFQFTLVLTATRARKPRVALNQTPLRDGPEGAGAGCCACCACCGSCCGSEVWSILVMVLFQDGPFLATRLYVTITYRLFSYNIIFFTAKNALIILLQFYRFVVVCAEIRKRNRERAYDTGTELAAGKYTAALGQGVNGSDSHLKLKGEPAGQNGHSTDDDAYY